MTKHLTQEGLEKLKNPALGGPRRLERKRRISCGQRGPVVCRGTDFAIGSWSGAGRLRELSRHAEVFEGVTLHCEVI